MNNEQKRLKEQVESLKKMKNNDALLENLKEKIELGIIYQNLTEEEVKEVFQGKSQNTLNEGAVCYIDNAGNVKSTSTEEYNKSQHQYNTEMSVIKKTKKKKKDLTEEVDAEEGE